MLPERIMRTVLIDRLLIIVLARTVAVGLLSAPDILGHLAQTLSLRLRLALVLILILIQILVQILIQGFLFSPFIITHDVPPILHTVRMT